MKKIKDENPSIQSTRQMRTQADTQPKANIEANNQQNNQVKTLYAKSTHDNKMTINYSL
jgi:hypothetical protein